MSLATIRTFAHGERRYRHAIDLDTDEVLLTGFLSKIIPMTDEQIRRAPLESVVLRSEVMFAFGTHFGAFVAVGTADPAAFCDKAEQARQDPALLARTWLPRE